MWKGCEVEMIQRVEFIESYIKIGNGDYQWNDNHGELIRCKDCRHCTFSDGEQLADCMIKQGWFPVKPDWFCADGVKRDG